MAAKDGGGRVGFTNVNLKILDKDDNKPLFYASQYKANIYFTADVGEVVVKVKAIDKDSGAEVEYSIIDGKGGQASKLFEVDRETGEIKVKKSLENHSKHSIVLVFEIVCLCWYCNRIQSIKTIY